MARTRCGCARKAMRCRALRRRRAGLTVAVTGPTGEIGQARRRGARALARGGAHPRHGAAARSTRAARGWKKVSYRRGDVLDRAAVAALVEEADVVVHLAFMIMGGAKESRAVNLDGSRNVFEAARRGGRQAAGLRLLGGRLRLPSRQPAAADRGRPGARHRTPTTTPRRRRRSRQLLARHARAAARPPPTSSAPASSPGRDAPLLIDSLPYTQISERLPRAGAAACSTACRSSSRCCPTRASRSSSCTTTTSPRRCARRCSAAAAPGVYNLAGPGQLTVKQLAEELGWYSIPVPELAVDAVAEMIGRLGFLPAQAQWIARLPRARDHERGQGAARARLAPRAHDALADAARDDHGRPHGPADPLVARGDRHRALARKPSSVCSPS